MTSVLVVEDERVVARDISETLSDLGYDVVGAAASGEECLEYARTARPDLVLMDVRIRGAIDGVETAKRLKFAMDVPVIYLTAYADDDTVSRASETQAHGYLLKPFRESQLKSAVEIALFKHRLEIERKREQRWYQTTLQAIGDGVITVDPESVVSFANAAAAELLGESISALTGHKISEVFRLINSRTRQTLPDPVSEVLREKVTVRLPAGTVLLRGSDELPIEDSVAPIVDNAGDLLGAVVVFRDLREQQALRDQVAAADRLASLGTLAAGVAHEINNPLTYLMANIAMIAQEIGDIGDVMSESLDVRAPLAENALKQLVSIQRQLAEAEDGAERIRRIVADLRTFARPGPGPRRGDVVEALRWALRVTEGLLSTRARIELDIQPVPSVAGDAMRLGQVFINLLVNAAQAMQEGAASDQTIFVSTGLCDGHVVVTVRDTGHGMTPEVLGRIFDPFFTTKPVGSGTGLGLSVSRSILESMGGDVTVESTPRRGSTFVVRVPVADESLRETSAPSAQIEVLHGRILVIDNDKVVAGAVARMLAKNHRVEVESDARKALKILKRDPSFDVIICDLVMPGMSGSEVYFEIADVDPGLARRILFLSGAFVSEASEFLASVSNPRLPKPPSRKELEECVQGMLRGKGVTDSQADGELTAARVPDSQRRRTVAPHSSRPPPPLPAAHAKPCVLIVDDEPDLARVLARTLRRAGFEATHCTSASAALELIEREPFDAVLSDLSMPKQDGIELLRMIRARDADLPVILLTGYPQLETAVPAVEYCAFRYLLKPASEKELTETLQQAVNLYRLATLKRAALKALGTGVGEASDRAALEASFVRAMDSLWPAFQPIVDVNRRSLFGYEALLRTDEPSLPHPGAVLDAASRLGQLHTVGRTMRERASAMLQQMDSGATLFLNLHPEDLLDPMLLSPDCPHMTSAKRIVLEVTERSALDQVAGARGKVTALREAGFRIAVDDLGAGYAGLSSFIQLEPDLVKLDMSLTRGVDSSPKKQRLVRSMTEVCKDLGLTVVGEGVETCDERDALVELGCDLVQGYLFGRPARELMSARW